MAKLLNTDPRVLDDISNLSDDIKEFHNHKAEIEARQIVAKYSRTPSFLKLISGKIAQQADRLYNSHMQSIADSNPELAAKAKLKAEVMAEINRDLGIGDDQ